MPTQLPVRGKPLADQVLEILAARIRSGVYPTESQLPPEHDLAAEFGVSRSTVRVAISSLAARGLVVKRQGVGTFISQLSGLSNPLNEAMDFNDLITSNGFVAGVELIKARISPAEDELAAALRIQPDDLVLQAHKVFTANDEPVSYSINSVPCWAIKKELPENLDNYPGLLEPLYVFLESHCEQRVEYHIARLRPDIVQNCKVEHALPHDPLTPMLIISEVGFNASERPVFHALEYYPGDLMTFEIIRRRGPIS